MTELDEGLKQTIFARQYEQGDAESRERFKDMVTRVYYMGDLGARAPDGTNYLHWCGLNDSSPAVADLLSRSDWIAGFPKGVKQVLPVANINSLNVEGRTPMHEAARKGNEALVQFYVDHRSRRFALDAPDASGQTSAQLARSAGFSVLADRIEAMAHDEKLQDIAIEAVLNRAAQPARSFFSFVPEAAKKTWDYITSLASLRRDATPAAIVKPIKPQKTNPRVKC